MNNEGLFRPQGLLINTLIGKEFSYCFMFLDWSCWLLLRIQRNKCWREAEWSQQLPQKVSILLKLSVLRISHINESSQTTFLYLSPTNQSENALEIQFHQSIIYRQLTNSMQDLENSPFLLDFQEVEEEPYSWLQGNCWVCHQLSHECPLCRLQTYWDRGLLCIIIL